MSTAATTLTDTLIQRSRGRLAMIYLKEAKYEFLKNLRLRAYAVSTILFPVMFYVLFGLVMANQGIGPIRSATYLIATYGTFAVMGASLFGTGAGLASDRGLGWLQVKQASPMPPFAYFAAKIATSLIFSTVTVLILLLLGVLFGGVRIPIAQAAMLVATLLAGSLPFCAMGLAIGYFAGPNSAPATINLIYLPLSFCSGLWVPYMFLPSFIRQIALALPPYHLSQLALSIVGAGRHESPWIHWEVLLGFTLVCLGVARIGFQRDEGKLYG